MARDGHAWAVTITPHGSEVEIGAPRPILGGRILPDTLQILAYVRARDRFLAAREADPPRSPKLVVVSDWKAALGESAGRPRTLLRPVGSASFQELIGKPNSRFDLRLQLAQRA